LLYLAFVPKQKRVERRVRLHRRNVRLCHDVSCGTSYSRVVLLAVTCLTETAAGEVLGRQSPAAYRTSRKLAALLTNVRRRTETAVDTTYNITTILLTYRHTFITTLSVKCGENSTVKDVDKPALTGAASMSAWSLSSGRRKASASCNADISS